MCVYVCLAVPHHFIVARLVEIYARDAVLLPFTVTVFKKRDYTGIVHTPDIN